MRIKLGAGMLSWTSSERVSDRYGSVNLWRDGQEKPLLRIEEGQYGKLVIVVTSTRQSTHIGDLYHGLFPSTPELGEEIELGEGYLFYGPSRSTVGLLPRDGREHWWLDPKKLYQVHAQEVELFFEKIPDTATKEEVLAAIQALRGSDRYIADRVVEAVLKALEDKS